METIIIFLVVFLIWWFIGIGILVYDITTDDDLKVSDLRFVLGLGLGGLITLIVVLDEYIEFEWKIKDTVLIKKRKS